MNEGRSKGGPTEALDQQFNHLKCFQLTQPKEYPLSCCTRPSGLAAPSSSCSSSWPSSCCAASRAATSSSSRIRGPIERIITSRTWPELRWGRSWTRRRRISGLVTISSNWRASTVTRPWTQLWQDQPRRTTDQRRRWTVRGTTASWRTQVSKSFSAFVYFLPSQSFSVQSFFNFWFALKIVFRNRDLFPNQFCLIFLSVEICFSLPTLFHFVSLFLFCRPVAGTESEVSFSLLGGQKRRHSRVPSPHNTSTASSRLLSVSGKPIKIAAINGKPRVHRYLSKECEFALSWFVQNLLIFLLQFCLIKHDVLIIMISLFLLKHGFNLLLTQNALV